LFGFLAFVLSLRWCPLPSQPKEPDALRQWRRIRRRWLWKGILFAAAIVYSVYFILSWNQPTDSLWRLGSSFASLVARRLLMPPWLYLRGLTIFILESSRATFILGHSYPRGVWFYFPVVFALKSTLAFLALLALAVATAIVAKRRLAHGAVIPGEFEFHWRAVWVFLAVFVAACMLGRLDLSIRHFTVPIALMILLLAPLPRMLAELTRSGWTGARMVTGVAALLACASLVTAVRAYPYYIPFLNSLSFGWPGYALVNDSNLDWNQALPDAADFVARHGVKQVLLDEYGFSDPTAYIPGAQFWDCQQPSPSDAGRWAIVSAGMIEDGHNCLWLMAYPHEVLAGGSASTATRDSRSWGAGRAATAERVQIFRRDAGQNGGARHFLEMHSGPDTASAKFRCHGCAIRGSAEEALTGLLGSARSSCRQICSRSPRR
jgi:hypothetical protein